MAAGTLHVHMEPLQRVPAGGMVEWTEVGPPLFGVAGITLAPRELISVRVLRAVTIRTIRAQAHERASQGSRLTFERPNICRNNPFRSMTAPTVCFPMFALESVPR